MQPLDLRAMSMALFLPLLLWTGAVIAVSLMGYPGIACMTPVAWLLALPVGLRVRHDSESPGRQPLLEAAIAGAILGFWEGMILAAVVASTPYLPGLGITDLPSPIFTALLGLIPGIPITTALAAGVAWVRR